jgi:hypothetical protein
MLNRLTSLTVTHSKAIKMLRVAAMAAVLVVLFALPHLVSAGPDIFGP